MKTIVLVLCVVAAARAHTVQLSDTQKAKTMAHFNDCMHETGVKPEVITAVKNGHITEDEALKKFTLCFFQKTGIMSSDGKLNIETALSKLPSGVDKEETEKLLEKCKSKTGKDHADTAFEIFKCYRDGTKTHIALGF